MSSKSAPKKKAKRPTGSKVSQTQQPGRKPRATRPIIPASYRFPTSAKGLLEWSWGRERLTQSHNYVIVTVRPDGRPHAMGMHGVWFNDAYYFGTEADTRKAKNLAANPHCILINEKLDNLVIVEGTAQVVEHDALPKGLSDASKKKYGWPMGPEMGGLVYKLTPRVAFAFPEKQIATAVTRWLFE